MTQITLLDGTKKNYRTTENDTYKFFMGSGVHGDMAELQQALTLLGNKCTLDFDSVYGWFVRVKK